MGCYYACAGQCTEVLMQGTRLSVQTPARRPPCLRRLSAVDRSFAFPRGGRGNCNVRKSNARQRTEAERKTVADETPCHSSTSVPESLIVPSFRLLWVTLPRTHLARKRCAALPKVFTERTDWKYLHLDLDATHRDHPQSYTENFFPCSRPRHMRRATKLRKTSTQQPCPASQTTVLLHSTTTTTTCTRLPIRDRHHGCSKEDQKVW